MQRARRFWKIRHFPNRASRDADVAAYRPTPELMATGVEAYKMKEANAAIKRVQRAAITIQILSLSPPRTQNTQTVNRGGVNKQHPVSPDPKRDTQTRRARGARPRICVYAHVERHVCSTRIVRMRRALKPHSHDRPRTCVYAHAERRVELPGDTALTSQNVHGSNLLGATK